ncbi:VWA domain-containing protein [Microbacterium sp. NEAU-LLC]|uniref:VWA domain-containing protein n=1 Tax=Microbacterium helvum TaxID=2773713 RepID=A0ABR8NPH6_9MICO|nr:SpaA isopeptide-forming pilin-related protein [Microbacterium helvum]MBD3942558.1 VWA domain-containing protein [Microbacterium helvum]
MRHRWYAGGIATLLSGALIFAGMSPALANETPAPTPSPSATTESTDTGDAEKDAATPAPSDDEAVTPEPEKSEPAPEPEPEKSEPAPAPEQSEPAPVKTDEGESETDAATQKPQSRSLAAEAPIAPLAAGPDGGQPPYIYWRAVDQDGVLLGGTTFNVERRSGNNWVGDTSITDNGPGDLDPDLGEFLVKTVGSNAVTANSRYRVQLTDAPAGYNVTDDDARSINSNTNWTTYNFGDFTSTKVQPGTITIQKGGLRTGGQTVAGLQDAVFEVRTGTDAAPDMSAGGLIGSCTTAANGRCSISVPSGAQYWIVEKTAPTGWSSVSQFNVGNPAANTAYRFRTGTVAAGSDTSYPQVGTGNGATASGGFWADIKNNPAALQACGIRVGLLIDLSNSIDSGEFTQLKNAANGFVDALQGTPSSLAVWTFASQAPVGGASNSTLGLTSVSTAGGATTVKNKINGLTKPSESLGATNWDQGLWQVAGDAANKVDVLLMLTDGTPTVYGPNAEGPGNFSRFREVENAVFSANAVKNLGTRVVPVGIGVDGAEANIQAISGPAVNSDYYLVANYSALATFLQNLAKGQCESTINVTKMVIPNGGTVANATPTPGWGFGATSGNAVTPSNGTTNASGAISFKVSGLSAGSSTPVTITEEDRAGYTPAPQGGKNAVCKNDLDQPVTVTNVGALGFTANATGGRIVTCTVYNQAPNPKVDLKVEKKWVINGVPYDNGSQPIGSAQLTLDGAAKNFGTNYTYDVGTSVAIAETVTQLPPFCTNTSTGTGSHTMTSTPNPNVITITNTVTCTTQLKLTKKVVGGSADPTTWTLTGTGPQGSLPGPNAKSPTGLTNVTPGVIYTLAESGGDPRYTQEVVPGATPRPGSTGSWHCYVLNENGTRGDEYDGLNGGVTVQLGQHVECEAINRTASLVLRKHVVNDNGGDADPSDWDLKATPAPLTGLATPPAVEGADSTTAANTIQVRPDHTYTVSETGLTGYTKVKLQQLVGADWVDVEGWDVTVAPGATGVYQIVNDDIAPKLTLKKVVVNDNGGTTPDTAWTLSATTEDGPDLSGQTGVNGEVVAGEVYTLAESVIGGYDFKALSCTGYPNTTKGSPTLTLKPGDDVTCTFTNDDKPGTLRLLKVVDNSNGGDKVATDWNQHLTATLGATTLTFDHNVPRTVDAGTYTLAEIDQLAGYQLTNLVCSTGGTSLAAPTVTVPNGVEVVCTFTNSSQKPTLTLEKKVVNDGGGSATANQWTLTAKNEANSDTPINGTGTQVGGDPLLAAISGQVVAGRAYVLSESGPSGYSQDGAWSCVITGTQTAVALTDGAVKVPLAKDVTCRIVNNDTDATGSIAKTASTPVQQPDGTWSIDYTVTVTNSSATGSYAYKVNDTFLFGAGITVGTATVDNSGAPGSTLTAGWDGAAQPQLATGTVPAGAGNTHVFVIHVTGIAIADSVADGDAWKCETPEPGGFANRTDLFTRTGTTPAGTAYACKEPAFPTVTKTGTNPASQNPDGSFNVVYTVTVMNPDPTAVQAALTDAFPAAPAGWTLVDGVWNVAAVDAAPAPTAATFAPGNGTIWQGVLPPTASYAYTVSGKLLPSTDAVSIGDCAAQAGLKNKATVTSGQVVKDAEGCVTVVLPPVSVSKTDGTVTQLDGGDWQVDYTVTVTNSSLTTGTVYTLTDLPDLGVGFSVVSEGWQGAAPVANTPIEAGGSDEYVYRIVASFDPAAEDPELTCEPGEGGAFHNVATVVYPGGSKSDDGCGQPASPEVVKDSATIAQQGTDWLLGYTVTVTNPSAIPLWYSLSDTPAALPAGVSGAVWTAEGPADLDGGTFTAPATAFDGVGNTLVGTGTLPAGASHVFTITAQVTLSNDVKAADLVCGEEPGTGVWNTATVTNGVGGDEDDACDGIRLPKVGIEKSDAKVAQNVDGEWVLSYDVTVTNLDPTLSAAYALADTPQFDASFDVVPGSETWTQDGTPGIPAGVLAGGASTVWTYTVKATVDAEDFDPETALTCTTEGETPGGGFYNVATVTFPGGTASDDGCGVPTSPKVEKTGVAAVQDASTGEWTLAYKVKVYNPTSTPLQYVVHDTPQALPAGVTPVGIWAASIDSIGAGNVGTLGATWAADHTQPLGAGLLTQNSQNVYLVVLKVKIAASVPDSALDCEAQGKGLWNHTVITNGIGGNESGDCIPVVRAVTEQSKTVTSTSQGEDGTWTITYDIVVTNTSTEAPATYSVTDRLEFGGDIEVQDASWTGPGGTDVPFANAGDDWTADIATDATLAPKTDTTGTATYTVTVHATVPAEAWNGDTLGCYPDDEDPSGGFLNTAVITVAGEEYPVDDCSEPALPTIDKTATSATQNPDDPDSWTVTYQLTVNPSGFDTFYTLTDVPGFPSGITLGDGTAQRTTPAGDEPIDIEPGASFPDDPVALGANETQVWTVSWKATVTEPVPTNELECSEGPGYGYFNAAYLYVGDDQVDDGTACIPVKEAVYPTVAKTVTSSTQDPSTGQWTIVYNLTASLAAAGTPENPDGLSAKYSLQDVVEFGGGIQIDSATWSGEGQTDVAFDDSDWSASIANGKAITAGSTHTYTVTVKADVTAEAMNDGTTVCDEGGEGPSGGFLNTARLTSGGQTGVVHACAEPVFPTVEKTAGAYTQNGDGTQSISYVVTVTYPETDADPKPAEVGYVLTDAPTLPDGVDLVGDWTAEAADAVTPAVPASGASWNGEGEWTIVPAGTLTPDGPVHTYVVSAKVKVSGPPTTEQPRTCFEAQEGGYFVWNEAVIHSGEYVDRDDACQTVHFDDVGIEKTATNLPEEGSIDPGTVFDYELTVTNNGTRDAENVVVSDPLHERLEVTGLTLPAGWSNDNAPAFVDDDNTLSVRIPTLAVGASAKIVVQVTFLPPTTSATLPEVIGDDEPPAPPTPLDDILNEACVSADHDSDPTNDCDEVTTPTRDIAALVYTRCVADAPYLGWVVTKSESLKDEPVNFLWKPVNDAVTPETSPAQVELSDNGSTTWSDEIPWVGSAFTPSGVSIDYPGWRPIAASDIVAGSTPTQYYLPGTTTVMTPEQQAQFVFNGLILDPSELDYSWRLNTEITFTVNPTLTFSTSYPAATPQCFVARHTEVQVEKSASVEHTEPGTSFRYTLDVANVSDDAAAEGVVVTDVIPADVKITAVDWTGKGDADAFPNWQSCEVAGQDAGGYGGTLTCELFGPLQPINSDNGGATVAPRITLDATVNPKSTANTITNVAVVDYHTFGDPDDPGRDSDDATVLLSALPATGGGATLPLIILGLVVMLTGTSVLLMSRRRRGEPKPQL